MKNRAGLRRCLSASTVSAVSCIRVKEVDPGGSGCPHEFLVSTPPTSMTDGSRENTSFVEGKHSHIATGSPPIHDKIPTRRSLRARSTTISYSLNAVSDLEYCRTSNGKDAESPCMLQELDGEFDGRMNMDWRRSTDLTGEIPTTARPSEQRAERKSSEPKIPADESNNCRSTLSKRTRGTVHSGMEKLGLGNKRFSTRLRSASQLSAVRKARKTATEKKAERVLLASASKEAKPEDNPSEMAGLTSTNITQITMGNTKYYPAGLYHGIVPNAKTSTRRKNPKKGSEDQDDSRTHLPYLMGYKAELDGVDFKIPFDVFAPLKKQARPQDWQKLNKNRFVDEAKYIWKVSKPKETSTCLCNTPERGEEGCGEDCLNRTMFYECDETNCTLPASLCSNRAFSELATRAKRGTEYDTGVEIVKTKDRGFGIRSNRTFAPGQIIIEYCGEVITRSECDRRMNETYKDSKCYYLMEFDQGMIIDATKGNIARFINHSCDPNCQMEKRIVKSVPKMALFAGSRGIMTGEELTYDYDFKNFSETSILACRCGSPRCRGKLERRNAKKERESHLDDETKRKVESQLSLGPVSVTECPATKGVHLGDKRKTFRARGWAYLDSKMELKRLREDAVEKGTVLDGTVVAHLEEQIRVRKSKKTADVKETDPREARRLSRGRKSKDAAGKGIQRKHSVMGRVNRFTGSASNLLVANDAGRGSHREDSMGSFSAGSKKLLSIIREGKRRQDTGETVEEEIIVVAIPE